jgi:hypothetical protein
MKIIYSNCLNIMKMNRKSNLVSTTELSAIGY